MVSLVRGDGLVRTKPGERLPYSSGPYGRRVLSVTMQGVVLRVHQLHGSCQLHASTRLEASISSPFVNAWESSVNSHAEGEVTVVKKCPSNCINSIYIYLYNVNESNCYSTSAYRFRWNDAVYRILQIVCLAGGPSTVCLPCFSLFLLNFCLQLLLSHSFAKSATYPLWIQLCDDTHLQHTLRRVSENNFCSTYSLLHGCPVNA